MKEKIGNVVLNYEYYTGCDEYCDGPVEDELLSIVKEYKEAEYNEIITERKKWPIFYHLSDIRSNIIEWYPINKKQRVLEIGSGCGAMTGVLAKKAHSVTCIELSKKRSTINAYRNQDYDNIEILVGNFETIEKSLTETYDVITLIGVLEYAASYISSENPYEEFLRMIKKHLKPNGQVLVAIENKFGLKYFAGCAEDHVGRFYEGLEGYPNTQGIRTFSKSELQKIVDHAGFTKSIFYYPYPDYKFPRVIYSDERLPFKGELCHNIRNFDRGRYITFDETKVFDNLLEEDMFPFFSNSYFAALSLDENFEIDTLYSKFSNDRCSDFSIRTDICKNKDGRIIVKAPITTQAEEHIRSLQKKKEQLEKTLDANVFLINKGELKEQKCILEYLEGQSLQDNILKSYEEGNYRKVAEIVQEYSSKLKSGKLMPFQNSVEFERVFGRIDLPNTLLCLDCTDIDMIFENIIVEDGIWKVIDYEWTFDFLIPINYVVYRAIHTLCISVPQILQQVQLYEIADISQEEIDVYTKMEINFQKYVEGRRHSVDEIGVYMKKECVNVADLVGDKMREGAQIFYDTSNGFSEANSSVISCRREDNIYYLDSFVLPENCKMIRIDPVETSCFLSDIRVEDESGRMLQFSTNCDMYLTDGNFYFIKDPQILVTVDESKELKVSYCCVCMEKSADIEECMNSISCVHQNVVGRKEELEKEKKELEKEKKELEKEKKELEKQVNDVSTQLTQLLESTSWKLTKPLRYIKRKIKN